MKSSQMMRRWTPGRLTSARGPGMQSTSWAKRAKIWAAGKMPCDLPVIDTDHVPETKPRDVFVYFIHEGKLRAPAAAMGLIERLD